MMTPYQSAGFIAYGISAALMDGFRAVRQNNERRQTQVAVNAWSGAHSKAQGSADAIADVAVAAIERVAELEDEIAALRRAVTYRDEALPHLS